MIDSYFVVDGGVVILRFVWVMNGNEAWGYGVHAYSQERVGMG